MDPTGTRWRDWPRILSEDLRPVTEPLALLVKPGPAGSPAAVATLAARALVGGTEGGSARLTLPPWLAAHQVPAARRIAATLERYGGALLADAVGLGKSYVALAVAIALGEPFALVVPAVLEDQWRGLLERLGTDAPVVTHEALSTNTVPLMTPLRVRLFIVDEAHRFRNRDTCRYHALAKLVVGARVLLVTATPVHNRIADLLHPFQLFLRDDALTGLGVPSLHGASRGNAALTLLPAAVARLIVARSRARVQTHYAARTPASGPALVFPRRAPGHTVRAGPLPDADCDRVVEAVARLRGPGRAGVLFRLLLLARLASSVPAFLDSLRRYEAFLALAGEAGRAGRALTPREFGRIFPDRDVSADQLLLFPLMLPPGTSGDHPDDLATIAPLRALVADAPDPKVALLEELLGRERGKTIVFSGARATARYLARRLSRLRVATMLGDQGVIGSGRATRREVLQWFAPRAQQAASPPTALETDVLIATDLLSEGVNLQDAARVIHYDLPWSPARLAQRVGRIDRLGSLHGEIETVSFLPPAPLARALQLEQRHLHKARTQAATGAEIETVRGREQGSHSGLDWCDRLQALDRAADSPTAGSWATIRAATHERVVVLVVRLGALVEAIVVDRGGARPDPVAASRWLERAATARPVPGDPTVVEDAIGRAAPLMRARLAAIVEARWRSADRDRLGRRLIPWVLAAARRAARGGSEAALARLDALVSRLTGGMTAGEELLLEELVERGAPLTVSDLLAWHARLPPLTSPTEHPDPELVAALVVEPLALPVAQE